MYKLDEKHLLEIVSTLSANYHKQGGHLTDKFFFERLEDVVGVIKDETFDVLGFKIPLSCKYSDYLHKFAGLKNSPDNDQFIKDGSVGLITVITVDEPDDTIDGTLWVAVLFGEDKNALVCERNHIMLAAGIIPNK